MAMWIDGSTAQELQRAPVRKFVAGRGNVVLEGTDRPALRNKLYGLAYEKCIPIGAAIEITLKCNLRCVHCYNLDRSASPPKEKVLDELRPDEVTRLIDELAEAGSLYVCFTGGEPLLHPNILDYVRHARRRRFAVKLKANGTLLTPRRVADLAEAGVMAVDVSIYGASAAVHEAFTAVPGSFVRAIEGIKIASEAGFDVRISCVMHEAAADEIEGLFELAEKLDTCVVLDPEIRSRNDGDADPRVHQLCRDKLLALYEGPLRALLPEPDPSPDRSVQCNCARSTVGISSTGDVYPCISAPVRAGNIREATFTEIWRSSPVLERIRKLRLEDFKDCVSCTDRPYCRRMSGYVYANTGNYTGAEAWLCMEAEVLRRVHEQTNA